MKLVNIGFGNMVNAQRVVAMVSPDSAPIKRIVEDAKEKAAIAVYTEPLDPETAKRYMKYIPAWA